MASVDPPGGLATTILMLPGGHAAVCARATNGVTTAPSTIARREIFMSVPLEILLWPPVYNYREHYARYPWPIRGKPL